MTVILGQHVQRGCGHGNVGTSRSIWSLSSESGISSAKYITVEGFSQLIRCDRVQDSYEEQGF